VKIAPIIPVTLFALSLTTLPATAAMEVMDDSALDATTAAGQPTVLIADNGTANFKDAALQTLVLVENAQVGLRALAITNVVGEAQLLVNLNVLSVSGDIAGGDQRNFAMQSWGSTLPEIATSEPGSPAIEYCPGGGCSLGDITESGTVTTNIASSPEIEIASASGDVIVKGHEGVDVTDASGATLAFEPNAQTDLAGLFIANIVGRSQAAFNVNIASSTLNLFPSNDHAFTEPVGSTSAVMKQVNSGIQFRGTPINAAASIFVDPTP
jgi:hypothetical protein